MGAFEPMGPRAFFAFVVGLGAALLALVAGLDLAMDPYGAAEGRWYRLRAPGWTLASDRTPDHGLAARATAAQRGGFGVLLLGTSRTFWGFAPRPDRLNAGITNGAFDEHLRILRAAAASPQPPRFALVEAPAVLAVAPERRHFLAADWPSPIERLLSVAAADVSLHLWLEPPPPLPPSQDAAGRARGRAYAANAFVANGEAAPPDYLPRALAELTRLCRTSGMRTILYEPPLHPDLLRDAAIASAVRAREAAYRSALAMTARDSCRPILADRSGLSSPPLAATQDPRNWYDEHHFNPAVGDELARSLLAEAVQAANR
jgi:hypothetical protein